jgi:predicted acetyltransferase
MKIDIIPANLDDKTILQNLMELYLHDFSEFDSATVNPHGCFSYQYLDHFWTEENRHPFLVRVDGHLAGFVLVQKTADFTRISEFFIMRKYRRQGVGREVAYRIFDRFPGKWAVEVIAENTPAQPFWRKVVEAYTAGQSREEKTEWGFRHLFDNTKQHQKTGEVAKSVKVYSRLGEYPGVVVGDVLYFDYEYSVNAPVGLPKNAPVGLPNPTEDSGTCQSSESPTADYESNPDNKTQRCFVLLNEGIQLRHEPWGWKNRWYADAIAVTHRTSDEIHLEDREIDIIIEGEGPTYRVIDLEEFGKAVAEGTIAPEAAQETLEQTQAFLDRYVHGGGDFPPMKIRPLLQ